jgi:hypothetical protein
MRELNDILTCSSQPLQEPSVDYFIVHKNAGVNDIIQIWRLVHFSEFASCHPCSLVADIVHIFSVWLHVANSNK